MMKKFALVLLFAALPLSLAACTCSAPSDSSMMNNAAHTEAASIYKPGDCFIRNNCKGNPIANLPSLEECVRRNGNSWVSGQAECISDIDQD